MHTSGFEGGVKMLTKICNIFYYDLLFYFLKNIYLILIVILIVTMQHKISLNTFIF